MSLTDNINEAIKNAMKAKDAISLRGLRAIKSAILIAQTEKGSTGTLNQEQEITLLQKLVKTRRDSLEVFESQKREDLAVKEREEIEVIEHYLPKQLSDDELAAILDEIIAKTGASDMKDMGKVMGMAQPLVAGKADNKKISAYIKSKLG